MRSLRAFIAVAEAGSVTSAAERLGYSQSAVSRQPADLERQIGAQVFDRERTGMPLTWRGRELLPAARVVIETIDELVVRRGMPDIV